MVDFARQSASETLKQIQSLLQKAADPHSKEVYTSCSENYDNAGADLDAALKALAAGDPETLNISVSAAMDEADTCKGDLENVSPDPSSIMKEIEDLENVSSIALVISNMLPKNNVFLSSLMFLLLIGSSYALTGAEVNAICGKALNPSFCLKFVKSNPKILAAGLPVVARITIDSAQATASKTLKQIQSLVQKATDPKAKQAYTSCLDNYEAAISNFDEAKEHLASGDPASVNIKVSAAMDGPQSCLDDLQNIKADPSVVKNSEEIGNVCGITLVISNMLPRRM